MKVKWRRLKGNKFSWMRSLKLAKLIFGYLFFSLRARFEQMQKEEPKLPTSASKIKVNRFVVSVKTQILFIVE